MATRAPAAAEEAARRRARDMEAVAAAVVAALAASSPRALVHVTVGGPRVRVRLQGAFDLETVALRVIGALDLARAEDAPEPEGGWEEEPAPLSPEPTVTYTDVMVTPPA